MPLTVVADFSRVCWYLSGPVAAVPSRVISAAVTDVPADRDRSEPLARRPVRGPDPGPQELSVCSTDAIRHADRRVIGGQSVRLGANSLRPELRSTGGQTILTVNVADWKPAPNLLFVEPPYGIEP